MTLETVPVTSEHLAEYAVVPIAFEVTSTVTARRVPGTASFALEEQAVEAPYIKDYDAISERPTDWPHQFDTSRWWMVLARIADQCIGGVAVALATPGVDLLEGRADLAVLWDIRVAPRFRAQGIGRRLFAAAEDIARVGRCVELKVETQNVNVAACRFYAAMGCELRVVVDNAYAASPGEAQYLWYKELYA